MGASSTKADTEGYSRPEGARRHRTHVCPTRPR
jgi:hypothetical protein